MSGYSLSAGRTNSWPSGRIPDIEKLYCTIGLPSDHGRVRTFCRPDYRSHKMDRNIRGSKWPSRQGTRRRDLPAHLNETSFPFVCRRGDQISADFAALHESASGTSVWTGRALQAESEDLEVIGLALLYPALERNVCVPGHHGYPRASDLILGKAQRGRSCHQITDATARPFLHLFIPARRPRRESQH